MVQEGKILKLQQKNRSSNQLLQSIGSNQRYQVVLTAKQPHLSPQIPLQKQIPPQALNKVN